MFQLEPSKATATELGPYGKSSACSKAGLAVPLSAVSDRRDRSTPAVRPTAWRSAASHRGHYGARAAAGITGGGERGGAEV